MKNDALHAFISNARWFGGKGREWSLRDVHRLGELPAGDGPRVVIDLAVVAYAEGDTEYYQLPLSLYAAAPDALAHALVGEWEEDGVLVHVHDAVHDREAMAAWLAAFNVASGPSAHSLEALTFHRLPGHDLDLGAHSTLFAGEQSNSSVAFGEDALLKIFRKVTPGSNPDISVHEVLTAAGSEHVAALYGWLDCAVTGGAERLQLAMLQQFLRTATDGWDLALNSVRNLFVEADLHADEVGGDFAAEAARLGEAVAEVHDDLARHFPIDTLVGDDLAKVVASMNRRLDEAVEIVPELADHEAALREAYGALSALGRLPVQQIHGDLHLGQTLRTVKGWKIVDFEGEPARPLAERVRPDSVWRDVAGMMRSFDYAPHVVALTSQTAQGEDEMHQQAYRALEWSTRNGAAFLRAYLGRPPGEAEQAVLAAYLMDKAVYEAVYETRNRPTWVSVPLSAIERWLAS